MKDYYITGNSLTSLNQSGFKPRNFCINRLISITHNTYKSFHEGHEVRGVVLDISNLFEKVWDEGSLFKLKRK